LFLSNSAFRFSRLFVFAFWFGICWFECGKCVSVFVLEFVVLFDLSVKNMCIFVVEWLKCCIVEFVCWILEFGAGASICS
jgi:hypothetical protein